jgi:putative transferase (TIGR04331 family)
VFVATTALRDFWSLGGETVLLGPWCLPASALLDDRRAAPPVMPSPWQDRERFARAAADAARRYEKLLGALAEYLNGVHRAARSLRYWRIVAGPWLLHYTHAVYDRDAHLAEALHRYPDFQTVVLDAASFRIPTDTLDAVEQWRQRDLYNLQLFSQLLAERGHRYPARSGCESPARDDVLAGGVARRVARRMRDGASPVRRVFRDVVCRAALCDMENFSRRAIWQVAAATRFRALPVRFPAPPTTPVTFDVRRRGLADLPATDELERVMVRLLPHHLPALYLEGYDAARTRALRSARIPDVVVSAVGWYYDETFKYAAAEAAEKGARLVSAIHGAGYGFYRFNPSQEHEEAVSDSYFVWGNWAAESPRTRRYVPPPRLSAHCARRRHGNPARHGALFIATGGERYLSRFQSLPVTAQWLEYWDWQVRFFAALPPELRRQVTLRPHPSAEYPLREIMRRRCPEVAWDVGSSFYDALDRHAIVVIDNCETPVLEAFASDVPTLLFWDTRLWEAREDLVSCLDSLRKAGILCDGPEAAAGMLHLHHEEPRAWWDGDAVQTARRAFLERYADVQADWVARWAAALEDEIARSRPRREVAQ